MKQVYLKRRIFFSKILNLLSNDFTGGVGLHLYCLCFCLSPILCHDPFQRPDDHSGNINEYFQWIYAPAYSLGKTFIEKGFQSMWKEIGRAPFLAFFYISGSHSQWRRWSNWGISISRKIDVKSKEISFIQRYV